MKKKLKSLPSPNQDFQDWFGLLDSERVEYLLIGGVAVGLHGEPRETKDLDLWVRPSLENGARIVRSLEAFGLGSLGLTAEDFTQPDTIVQLA